MKNIKSCCAGRMKLLAELGNDESACTQRRYEGLSGISYDHCLLMIAY